jgi:hypothetical protein
LQVVFFLSNPRSFALGIILYILGRTN